MESVPRHPADVNFAQEQVESVGKMLETTFEYLERTPDALGNAIWQSVMRWNYQCVVDPAAEREETARYLATIVDIYAAAFAAAFEPEGTVPCEVDGTTYRVPAAGPNRLSSPQNLLAGLLFAAVHRDEERIQQLCGVNKYTMVASGVKADNYVLPWIDTLQRFLRHEDVPADLFTKVMELTDPDQATITPQDYMLRIAYPPIKMFYYLLRRDAEKFSEATVQAVTLHRDYWTHPDLAEEPDGFVALAPLAIAVLGKRVGLPVNVESEYLPHHLLR